MKTSSESRRGGARSGAGRKPGIANQRTREIADKAAASGVTPLEFMLDVMRKPYPEGADALAKAQADGLRLDAAKAAAPYIHPRLGNVDSPVRIGPLTGELADQGRTVLAALSEGRLTPTQAATVMQAIASQCRIIEIDELARRVAALEERGKE